MLLDEVNFVNTATKERVRRASATAHALVVETFFLLYQTHDQALLLVKLLLIIKRHYAVWPTLKFIRVIDLLRPRRYTECLLALSECSGSSHGIKLVVNAREVGPVRDVTLVVLESCGLRLLWLLGWLTSELCREHWEHFFILIYLDVLWSDVFNLLSMIRRFRIVRCLKNMLRCKIWRSWDYFNLVWFLLKSLICFLTYSSCNCSIFWTGHL